MRKALWVLFFVILWPLLTAETFMGRPYSAEMVVRSGKQETVSRIFVGGKDRWRIEGAQSQATIVRLDRKATYVVLPQAKVYYQTAVAEEDATPAFQQQPPGPGKVSRRVLAKEKVAGWPATKYETMVSRPGNKPVVTYEWFCEQLGVPLRTMPADKGWCMEYRNIKVGPQDSRLFDVPAGYRKLGIPSARGR
ncbi:MAG: hypothetical protein V2A77_03570 [Pseudomonadota bacterium]